MIKEKKLTFDDYQNKCFDLALPSAKSSQYLFAGLAGETGELCSLYAKSVRDGINSDFMDNVKKEIGDVLWFVAVIAHYHGLSLEDVAQANIDKLESRRKRNVITGSGDNR